MIAKTEWRPSGLVLALLLSGHMFAGWSATVTNVRQSLQQALAGRYVIERELGHGGSASVYLARDLKIPRQVALKVLTPELALAVRIERFQREVAIAAQLNHPHILPLFEADSVGGYFFYTMPPVHGESLGVRLAQMGRLPVDEARRIAGQVAAALEYAHSQGVIHRDIKPGNLLLDPTGHVWVADFGIARAIAGDKSEPLTETGGAPGTPFYMSPEQIRGSPLDGHTDIYSLGCVLYEMLAGAPPYTGPTPQSVYAKQLDDPVPPISKVRSDVPVGIARIIERAMAKEPDQRFRTAAEFRSDLTRGFPRRRVTMSHVVAVTLGTALIGGVAFAATRWIQPPAARLDRLRYVVLPLDRTDSTLARGLESQVRDALKSWSDISVVDERQVTEALADRGAGTLTNSDAQDVASSLGAGRFVRGEIAAVGDSLRIHATVYDATGTEAILPDATVKVGPDIADSLLRTLAEALLFGTGERGSRLEAERATRSFAARNAMARGLAAVDRWDLLAADSAFDAAAQADPDYAQAHLWLALARAWSGAELTRWRVAAEQAALRRERLSERDRDISDAVLNQARGDLGRACPIWRRVTTREPQRFAAWYGSAYCLAGDEAVLRDPASPSGWRFRTSYHTALLEYQRAFASLPSILRAFQPGSYEALRRLFMTGGYARRSGHALPPDTTTFDAVAEWRGDSLALVPYPAHATTLRRITRPGAREEALRHLRIEFRNVAQTWLTASPGDADALEAVAIGLGMLGDPRALDSLHRARTLVRDPDQRSRVAVAEVWMQIASALPSDQDALRRARSLADSLLEEQPPGRASDPLQLAGLAALTGRASLTASYYREPRVGDALGAPASLRASALPLLAYAALGGPADTLATLERSVRDAIEQRLPPGERLPARLQWLAWPATLAFPTFRFTSIAELEHKGDYLLDLQAAWVRGDTQAVRHGFENVREARREILPADLTLDALYPEAELLNALSDPQGAAMWLDPTLQALFQVAPHAPTSRMSAIRAAALVRAMALRARLAEQLGDREGAARWAAAVTILWSDADPFLQPMVRQLRRFEQ